MAVDWLGFGYAAAVVFRGFHDLFGFISAYGAYRLLQINETFVLKCLLAHSFKFMLLIFLIVFALVASAGITTGLSLLIVVQMLI
uniref:Uncharacterized protein n=1 Tax=Pygocentrus nattereri TaxID=42514 RepID=A0A3B4D7H3_PYGNA